MHKLETEVGKGKTQQEKKTRLALTVDLLSQINSKQNQENSRQLKPQPII